MEKPLIFLSWSRERSDRSRRVAEVLRTWLPDVLQNIDPFMSEEDIPPGELWFDKIGAKLRASRFIIICATPEALDSRWLYYEAGAIGMAHEPVEGSPDGAAVAPYLLGLEPTDLSPPLSLYNAVRADREGTLRLVKAINQRLPGKVDAARLQRTFDRCWSDLDRDLAAIPEPEAEVSVVKRSMEDMTQEILSVVRGIASTQVMESHVTTVAQGAHHTGLSYPLSVTDTGRVVVDLGNQRPAVWSRTFPVLTALTDEEDEEQLRRDLEDDEARRGYEHSGDVPDGEDEPSED